MCGIAGYIAKERSISPAQIESMSRILQRMQYRGPDHSSMWSKDSVLFGHRRLSIVDLSEQGNQPFHDLTNQIHVVFNGEIYNYQELKHELKSRGYAFRTQSDTEVLIACYLLLGHDFLSNLRGMFAFALFDERRHRLLLARDRMGKKPLFIFHDKQKIAFCSELKYFHAFNDIELSVKNESVVNYLTHQYVPGESTIYNEISSVAPGEVVIIDTMTWGVARRRYWTIEEHLDNVEFSLRRLDDLLRESVRYRLIADVDVGILLSGGIDSSLLACYARELGGPSIKAYSVRFTDSDLDESEFSKKVSGSMGLQLLSVPGDSIDGQLFDHVVFHADQPLGDPAMIPTYMIAKALSQHVKVVLSGEGADELFHGYGHYRQEYLLHLLEDVVSPRVLSAVVSVAPRKFIENSTFRAVGRLAKMYEWENHVGVGRWTSVFDVASLSELMSPAVVRDARARYEHEMSSIISRLAGVIGKYQASLFTDMAGWLPNDLLAKVDRMTMAHSVEARAPYLDQKVVEFASGIRADQKRKLFLDKAPLRQLLSSKLPPEVAESLSRRKKHGFSVPVTKWLKHDLRAVAEERFSEDSLSRVDGLEHAPIESLWKRFTRSSHPELFSRRLWLLLNYVSWYHQHKRRFGLAG